MELTIEFQITDEQISGLLCSALEGGSSYWYAQLDYELPEGIKFEEFCEGGARQYKNKDGSERYFFWGELIPLVEGCAITLCDKYDDQKLHRITRKEIESGMRIFAHKHPKHFANFLSEEEDGTTGDVFLQCVVFGEVRY